MKLIGGGSLFLGLGALGIPNLLKTFEASAGKTGSQVVSGVNSSSNITTTSPPAGGSGSQGSNIRPFQVNVPEAELVELRRRINATRFPERETVAMIRKAYSSPSFKRSRAIGLQITIGARSKRN
jgi:hypothetical protein